MNRKTRTLLFLSSLIVVFILAGFALAKESPRFMTSHISSVVFGKFVTQFVDYVRVPGSDFICQSDGDVSWACQTMFEGKQLDVTAYYKKDTDLSLVGCSVSFDGKAVPCQFSLGYGMSASVLINDDLGISVARMAELRAQRPLNYIDEGTWLVLGVAGAALLAFLILLFLLTAFDTKRVVALPGSLSHFPIWAVCFTAIVAALVITTTTGLSLVCVLGIGGSIVLTCLTVWLNHLDLKRSVVYAYPLKWASASVALFGLLNLGSIFLLLTLGFVD